MIYGPYGGQSHRPSILGLPFPCSENFIECGLLAMNQWPRSDQVAFRINNLRGGLGVRAWAREGRATLTGGPS